MKISEILQKNQVEIGAELYSKDEALDKLISLQKESGVIHDPRVLRREIYERERIGNSAVSGRIALPSTMHNGAVDTAISALTVKDGIEYHAPDKRPVKLMFLITGKSGTDEHISVKERIQKLLSDPTFTARLCAAETAEDFIKLIEEKERVRSRSPRGSHHYPYEK